MQEDLYEKIEDVIRVKTIDPRLDQPGIPEPEQVPEFEPMPVRRRLPIPRPVPKNPVRTPKEPSKPIKIPERVGEELDW